MDKLTDRVFKTKIVKTFKSKKFDRKLVSELNEEFENRTSGLDENELKLWKKYDDTLKAMINEINLNELFNDDNGDDHMDRNESDADDDDESDRNSQHDNDDDSHDSSSESDADAESEIKDELEKLRRKLKDLSLKKKKIKIDADRYILLDTVYDEKSKEILESIKWQIQPNTTSSEIKI